MQLTTEKRIHLLAQPASAAPVMSTTRRGSDVTLWHLLRRPGYQIAALSLMLVAGLGCLTRDEGSESSDAGPPDARLQDEPTTRPKLPPPERKPTGAPCSAQADCASGFCVDGVCCETACDTTCFACNVVGSAGSCIGLNNVEESTGTPPCAGSRICATDAAGITACSLKDGETCVLPSDCASGYCRSYYRDGDSDGYGADSPDTIVRCDATPQPPLGFTALGGDCCDLDPGASPASPATSYFTSRNRCGSYDWNCRNGEERQTSPSCPTTSGSNLACGQACTIVIKGTAGVLFVQACH